MKKIATALWLLAFTGAALADELHQVGAGEFQFTDSITLPSAPTLYWADPGIPINPPPGITVIVPPGSDVTIRDAKDNRVVIGDVKNGLRITGTVTGTTITVESVKSK